MTSSPASAPAAGPVRLEPFRGLHYAGTDRRTLADVTLSPPPLWDFSALAGLARTHPHHVLRLLSPSLTGQRSAAETAQRWLASGDLMVEDRPGLYAWRWTQHGHSVVGVAGALELPAAGVVPHEEVSAGLLTDRAAELGAGQVQPEPIMLLYDGEQSLTPDVAGAGPLVELRLDDAQHRVDVLGDAEELAQVNAALDGQALVVADGHHRFRVLSDLGRGTRAFVLVVDVRRSELAVGPIPRVVDGLGWETVTATPGAAFVDIVDTDRLGYLEDAPQGSLRWVVGDRTRLVGMELSVDASTSLGADPAETCGPFARDVCHLHSRLLPAWGVGADAVHYSHSWQRAVDEAGATSGLAIEARAPGLSEVITAARGGTLLPHKATSITPKPRAGLLMFDAAD